MAEAVVGGEPTSPPSRFYCHMCNLEINIYNNDYTCPLCAGGFIEELPPLTPVGGNSDTAAASSSSTTTGDNQSSSNNDPPRSDSPNSRMNDLVATLLMTRGMPPLTLNGPRELEISIDANGDASVVGSGSIGNISNVGRNRRGTAGGSGGSGRQRQTNVHRLDNVFLDFLSSLSGGEDGPFGGNSQMFFMGNPGDYAWGREGIDTVVTQLLNHMDSSGPPPLPKEKIAEIPTVEISETEVEQKLKCSVCWEDFKLQEAVRKLPCLHVYHENCIVPWLDLHGTCPICRKSLQLEPTCSMHNGAASTSGLPDIAMPIPMLSMPTATVSVTLTSQPGSSTPTARITSTRNVAPQPPAAASATTPTSAQAAQGSSTTTTTGQTTGQTSSSSSSNVMAFEDGNVEYDFD
ncbi:E3 ubiquitin-protein ligase Iruka [Episyrphus balteatus]|uniref:E3 ubiquitin-protein ligase Iruka n=1 Tax=Episyrphus balteatus TaxID=286459 RepID=UPI00248522F5|nr:E3 ubiquitin-protein ligase Iruka [Episyrphus balteatus]